MIHRQNKNVSVFVEESPKREIINPEYLLFMDELVMNNGDKYLVVKADKKEIKVSMTKIIKREDIPAFLSDLKHIVRADCFEKQ